MTLQEKSRRVIPALQSQDELEMVRLAQRCIMESLDHSKATKIRLTASDQSVPSITLPPNALRTVGQVLGLMGRGQPIVLMPADQEFSTTEAANYLNVSRPFVIKEIEAGRLKAHKVGTHRRIAHADLAAYRKAMRAGQDAALDRLAEINDELGLEY